MAPDGQAPPAWEPVYREACVGFSHVHCPEGLDRTLFSGCVLEHGPQRGPAGGTDIPGPGEGEGPLTAQGPLPGQPGPLPLRDLLPQADGRESPAASPPSAARRALVPASHAVTQLCFIFCFPFMGLRRRRDACPVGGGRGGRRGRVSESGVGG